MGSVVSNVIGSITGSGKVSDAANTAAEQQRQAGITAGNISAFRPVGMTTRFGSSQFTREIDPSTGMPYISSAGYTAAPELASLQNQLMAQYGNQFNFGQQQQALAQPMASGASRLFSLGEQILPSTYQSGPSAEAQALAAQYQGAMQGLMPTSYQTSASPEAQAYAQQLQQTGASYLAQSPEEARAEYVRTQQAALAPGQEQQLASIRNQLFQTGRAGLATGGTSQGMAATNPEMAAYYNSLAQQNANIAAGAEQAAQQRQTLGLGMLGQGYQTTAGAQQLARQNMLQNLTTGLGFGQQAYATTASAQDLARQRTAADITLGAGLFGTGGQLLGAQAGIGSAAYSPLQTILGLSGTTENLAQMPYQLGLQLGQAQQPGQSAGAAQYYAGQAAGANTQYQGQLQAQQMNNQFLSSLIGSAGMAAAGGAFGGGTGGLFGGNAGSGLGGLYNYGVRQFNQASPGFVGPSF